MYIILGGLRNTVLSNYLIINNQTTSEPATEHKYGLLITLEKNPNILIGCQHLSNYLIIYFLIQQHLYIQFMNNSWVLLRS